MDVVTELNVMFDNSVGWAKGNIFKSDLRRAYFLKIICVNMPVCALIKAPAYFLGKLM